MTSRGSHSTDKTTRSTTPSQDNEEAQHLAKTMRVHDTKPFCHDGHAHHDDRGHVSHLSRDVPRQPGLENLDEDGGNWMNA